VPLDYYDQNGFLSPGPTLPEWRRLRASLDGTEGKALVSTGISERPLALADEVRDSNDPVAQKLRSAAESADTVLFISQGTRPRSE
jgi:hypothetical protein